jgi:hypothetical protein
MAAPARSCPRAASALNHKVKLNSVTNPTNGMRCMMAVLLDAAGHSPSSDVVYPANEPDAATNRPRNHKKRVSKVGR